MSEVPERIMAQVAAYPSRKPRKVVLTGRACTSWWRDLAPPKILASGWSQHGRLCHGCYRLCLIRVVEERELCADCLGVDPPKPRPRRPRTVGEHDGTTRPRDLGPS